MFRTPLRPSSLACWAALPACLAVLPGRPRVELYDLGPSGCASSTLLDCSGHGKCTATGICRCDPGYSGSGCERAEYLFSCPANCSYPEGGECARAACRCNEGWSGDDCAKRTFVNCSAGCSGHGECLGGACACAPGYYGRYCELGCAGYVRSTGEPCSGHGMCRSTGSAGHAPDRCICHVGFEGAGCEVDSEGTTGCERGCSGHGHCRGNRCSCDRGYAGRDCSILLRYSNLAHAMDSPSSRLLACLLMLGVTSICACLAVRYIEVGTSSPISLQALPLKPMRKGVGPGGV